MRIYKRFKTMPRHKDIGLIWDKDLSLEAYGLYSLISARPINPLVDDLAKTMRVQDKDLSRSIKELTKAGLIRVEEE